MSLVIILLNCEKRKIQEVGTPVSITVTFESVKQEDLCECHSPHIHKVATVIKLCCFPCLSLSSFCQRCLSYSMRGLSAHLLLLTKKLRATVFSVYFVVKVLPEPDKENGSQWPHIQNWWWNKGDRILSLFIELNIKKMIIMWELEGY